MSHYNTGIGDNIPSILDMTSAAAAFLGDFVQLVLGTAQTSFQVATAAAEDADPGEYDAVSNSWEGTEGLRYRVPLFPIPSERHAREKVRNIKILMDNCRRICVNDELPATKEEKRFWASYRFMKYQLFFTPLVMVTPPLYLFWRVFHDRIPLWLRGRSVPLMLSLALAEQWAEAVYPGHQLLSTAMRARTPMGDAARAEWARLQPLDIPFHLYTSYQFHHFLGSVPLEYQFGGNLASLCN